MGLIVRYRDLLETYKTRGYRIRHLKDYKYLFPIKSSPLLAGIVADLMADGHLQANPKWRIDFTSKSIKELNNFNKRFNILFGVKGNIRECRTNKFGKTFNLGINCSPITRILFLLGVPHGQKVLKDFNIPKWILKDKECFKEFCKRIFTCEGSIMHEKRRKFPQIRMELWKKQDLENSVMFELGSYLNKHFNIKSTLTKPNLSNLRKDGVITQATRIYILGDSMLKFHKEIGFDGEKQAKLNRLLGG